MHKFLYLLSLLFINGCFGSLESMRFPDISESLSDFSSFVAPNVYKRDIKQGSVLRFNKLNQVELGQTKEEVYNLIGSPSVSDPFHQNQWDYFHKSIKMNDEVISFRVQMYFNKNKLSNIKITNREAISLIENLNINLDRDIFQEEILDDNKWYKFW